MITVTFYTRNDDPACQAVEELLSTTQAEQQFHLVKVNIDKDPSLKSVFDRSVPMVKIGPYTLYGDITAERLNMTIGAAQDRHSHLQRAGDQKYEERYRRARSLGIMDHFTGFLSGHYLFLFNLALFLYSGLPFLAPVLMKEDVTLPAHIIYTVYSPLCHQMAFRSWFLFGEQPYYPRALAGVPGVASYETAILQNQNVPETSAEFITTARAFIGNNQIGYKVAICERDIALYGGMFLFGMIFAITGRRIKQIPWYLWVIFGLIPIGIDGASQIPSMIANLPAWLPVRESTPFLRTLTGALFGTLTAWYMFPLIEETMKDTRALLASKREVVTQSRVS